MSGDYDYIDWFCDSCNANLNIQSGFTTETERWMCTECGVLNDILNNNILDEDYEEKQKL